MSGEEVSSYSAEGPFLHALFSRLNSSGIHYAVMRNYHSLPYSAGGSDLDILTTGAEYLRAKEIFLSVVAEAGGRVIGEVETWLFYEAYVIGYAGGQWWGVCVEFYKGVTYKSTVPLINYNALHGCLELHNNIKVISKDFGNTIGYVKEILAHDEFRADKPQYKESAAHLLKEYRSKFADVFEPLGPRGQLLLSSTLDAASATGDEAFRIRKFRRAVLSKAFFRDPLKFVCRRLRHEFNRFRRYLNPPGSVVAILGVDGAGKSTVINSILPALNAATHNAVVVQHLRPELLPPLARLKGKKSVQTGPVLEPHGSSPSGTIGSLLRLSYLTLNYVLGYWLWTRPKIAKRPAVVLFDRYAYDMAIDPRRFRIQLSPALIRLFARLAPKPDLIFCLHGAPEVLAARKQELPVEEVARQVQALKVFAATEPRALLIDTEQPVDVCRDQILQAIAEYCDRRRTR